jgi:hypothetical protein
MIEVITFVFDVKARGNGPAPILVMNSRRNRPIMTEDFPQKTM